ncbi:dTDP-4-dehydrorhamnose reductase family protein [Frateuria terrea]|uniref:dTDP-4-dehydrorhamnose reductase n=1 Tax=Frateuria terrea TaxID=529704 RepID=A0A1H6VW62_9GAMM|nr:SDR family oxidoreductase [Frateuria terrea]SEJ06067.1 dTDP-4-dehydrorhamnose reductase [Frateuria terrea]SFP70639.1 dTDP-4-dehydrorhamnose reductase [Frateuria terrea]
MKLMIIGITGMLGNTLFRYFSRTPDIQTFGTVRDERGKSYFDPARRDAILSGVDANRFDTVTSAFSKIKPDYVINAAGLIKQLQTSKDPLSALPMNALFPHRLAQLCVVAGARLVHISTDCVFTGTIGNYSETDPPDAIDIYGRSKLLGEVDYPHAITLRTSIIGHEMGSTNGLIAWFLSQNIQAQGFTRAVFTGLPTVELARIIEGYLIPRPDLHGLYHVASAPISKYDLLRLTATVYGKDIKIIPDDTVVIDRSLNADRFNRATGYQPPPWPKLVHAMKLFG